jgi:rhamnosyltransferase
MMGPIVSELGRRTAAIVVAYGPDPSKLNGLLAALAGECGAVFLMDNGGGQAAISSRGFDESLRIVDMGGNTGLGAALNRGFDLAAEAEFDYVATFDQDSEPGKGQIASLTAVLKQQIARGAKVAAVGPRIVDLREPKLLEHPFMRSVRGWPSAAFCTPGVDIIDVDFLITSGAVISIAAYRDVGPYDAGLFVDFTDIDWSFRALAHGYRLLGVCAVTMPHELGTGSASAIGIRVISYGPLRRYYYARNAMLLAARKHASAGWKARLTLGVVSRLILLPVAVRFSAGWTRSWTMLVKGFRDGLKGTDGAYNGLHPG